MAFDTTTRNNLAKLVTQCRGLLTEEFSKQCQSLYGIRPDGSVTQLDELRHLSDQELATAQQLRERIDYLVANDATATPEIAVDRLLREQAFTVMNRLAAMRMAEARGLIIESVAKGMESQGFEMYDMLGGAAMGDRFDRYRAYLFSMFDELAVDLGVLFDRYSPYGLLFPRETALKEFLDLLNQKAMESIWAEDETIGWIYQYWNSKEERKAMRDASAAPRNSRELAVRNQFFTPRYVVEFLTDNTLGRIWYEMTKGQTRLAEQCRYLVRRPTEIFLGEGEDAPDPPEGDTEETLSQEELLKQPVHIPHRPVKDPREIRLLDPACGSMHFGLYAFDLFEAIYEEAWDKGLCPALQEAYPEKADYLRDVPRLIIEHNIHGVDIDPRAVQIAGLSLWLRAQKTWKDTPAADRPRVRRSNIVCAEPMPGSDAMLEDFVQTLDPPMLGELVKTVFDKMQLAGEAGTLLKIEEEIRTAIDDAKEKWEKLGAAERDLFSAEELNQTLRPGAQQELTGVEKALTTDHRPLATDFFDTAEERIYAALRDYAESAEAGDYQRRLFAEDAAHGFAFIDLCRKRYDALVMNPPFGEFPSSFKEKSSLIYKSGGHDILTAFVERGLLLAENAGIVGAITSRTVFFAPTTAAWREDVILDRQLQTWCELGEGVLDDAMVETCMYSVTRTEPFTECSFFDKGTGGRFLEASSNRDDERDVHSEPKLISPASFKALPGAPFAYWTDASLLDAFTKHGDLGASGIAVKVGLQTGDDFRFVRCWWEHLTVPQGWYPHAKGGENLPYCSDIHLTVNWTDNGAQIRAHKKSTVRNTDRHFKPGLTFPYRTYRFSPSVMPQGVLTGVAGMGVYSESLDAMAVLAILNSSIANALVETRLPRRDLEALYQAGCVSPLPLPHLAKSRESDLAELGESLWRTAATPFLSAENSCLSAPPNLAAPPSLRQNKSTEERFLKTQSDALRKQFGDVDGVVADLYGFSQELTEPLHEAGEKSFARTLPQNSSLANEGDDQPLSWLLGFCFGRWDIRYATGERQPPELPDPFDPLPVCPPGMLQNADGLPAAPSDVPDDYPLPITWPGILVSDPGHPEDIVARVRDALAVIWGDRSAAIEQEACEILGLKQLRDYFTEKKSGGKFFKDHLKRYSKSRRQAPIYWPLSTESGSYTLWIYYHRLTEDTLYACITDFVAPKIEQVEKDLTRLQQIQQSGQADAKTTDEIGKLTDQLKELRDFQDELKRIAKFWRPNLNDGVQITAAPLWSLFRLGAWQKKLKDTWKKLEKGDYDWAHLAYSIWPDRVQEKCKKDKSLAIAHNLEHLYIDPPAKKKAKK